MDREQNRSGFTLIELLTVIAILAVIAGILFPVFARAREKGRQTRCISNLRQIGQAMLMYASDYDDLFPYAVDFADKSAPQIWAGFPDFQALIPSMPTIRDALMPYTGNVELWHCPSDTGFDDLDFTGESLPTHPESFQVHGLSYLFRTEVAFLKLQLSALPNPAGANILMDAHGSWHGGSPISKRRYNVLFGDGHVKHLNRGQVDDAWNTPIQ
ncbi:MAG: hypothetical protein AUJ92_00355 [Armatimonadetes bacterium CG2_30_59_28]|nr:DUF1559 domain-containing protein [Armatimonadota bacterium]OIO98987.1 MAG: hypothetical protein AUJ92_00355 [Armatimonadetes bacterium CG2_30_59_28]PIU66559.1 MAG: prepilin-type cleavage/methylation domain-containing protein [Armatimonadetes bacterium CG07_land_8_20_14_0_80_59_28]PIX42219.1 MAG: prepilin-type cleavage/methylation domain-containing protein [Armatimonadetes bacterium CG_4_8_14_3_um_filter_58_9]PJB64837.1 MAG: prepilin-type cleavage/methylation domain-containing protein [Armat